MTPTSNLLRKLTIVCLISSTVPSANALSSAITAAQALGILQRDSNTCANSTFSRCSDTKLPSNFCCPPSTQCISLDDSSSALCCPTGNDCTLIQPIICDISQQNATAHPDGPVHTTKLDNPLPQCGKGCCPNGYSCSNGACTLNKQISSPSSSLAAAPTSNAASSSTVATSASPTPSDAASATSPSCKPQPCAHCSKFPGAAVVAGFFPGMVLGILFALAGIVLLGRRAESRPNSSSSTSKLSHLRTRSADSHRGGILGVSDPISQPQQSARTDFLRRDPFPEPQQAFPARALSRTGQKVKSLFRPNDSRTYEQYPMNPVTPPQRNYAQEQTPPRPGMPLNREPSTESIKVYSPAYLARQNRPVTPQRQDTGLAPPTGVDALSRPQTTFTEMMERVGFTNGQGGSPRYNAQNPGNTPRR